MKKGKGFVGAGIIKSVEGVNLKGTDFLLVKVEDHISVKEINDVSEAFKSLDLKVPVLVLPVQVEIEALCRDELKKLQKIVNKILEKE